MIRRLAPQSAFRLSTPARAPLGIISGYYPGVRFGSQVNHQTYADQHGYHYVYNGAPPRRARSFFTKIETILRYQPLFDWVFWIDDDAYFTDFRAPLSALLENVGDHDLLICKSPSTKQVFTKLSSGQFFLRATPRARAFLEAALQTDLEMVRRWWRPELGLFSEGDQDAFVYLTETDPRFRDGFVKIADHSAFNNRDFEYRESLSEHFLVHFTGTEKAQSKEAFCRRLSCTKYLVPHDLLAQYQIVRDESVL